MDVQVHAYYPYDSVCMFLTQCLSIASHGVRLYWIQLEDNVLSWLIDSWSGTERAKSLFTWCQEHLYLSCLRLFVGYQNGCVAEMPDCGQCDRRTLGGQKSFRIFWLYTKLPSFQQNLTMCDKLNRAACVSDLRLLAPHGRERRI